MDEHELMRLGAEARIKLLTEKCEELRRFLQSCDIKPTIAPHWTQRPENRRRVREIVGAMNAARHKP